MPITLAVRNFGDSMRSSVPRILYRRFSDRAHAESFLETGEILIRNLLYYRGGEESDIDSADPRIDCLEGKFRFIPPKNTTLSIQNKQDGRWLKAGEIISLAQELPNPDRFFVYCLSTRLHKRQEKFGKYLIKILRPADFIDRLTNGIINRNHMSWGRVQYYDKTEESGKFMIHNLFRRGAPIWMMKPKNFSHEHEFRIAIERGDVSDLWKKRGGGTQHFDNIIDWQKKLTLKLIAGNMRDIACIV